MATLTELRTLFSNSGLTEKVQSAVVIAAYNLIDGGTPTAAQKSWAANVFTNPHNEAQKALMAVLAANAGLTVSQITSASDTAIQTEVNAVVQVLVDALAGA